VRAHPNLQTIYKTYGKRQTNNEKEIPNVETLTVNVTKPPCGIEVVLKNRTVC